MSQQRPSRRTLAALLAFAGCVACGGVGVAAPKTIGAFEDTGCPSASDALAHARAFIKGPLFDPLRPHLKTILNDNGGLHVILRGGGVLLANLDAGTFQDLLAGIDPSQGLAGLTPHLVDILQYIDGSSPYVDGPHEDPVVAAHAILSTCDAAATVATLDKLLALEVTIGPDGAPALAAPGTGDKTWLSAVLESARAALADQDVLDTLHAIQLDDTQGGTGIHVGKDAFDLVAKLLASNLAAPNFDPTFTQSLFDQVLVSRLTTDEGRAKVDDMLKLILLITDPSADVFPDVQSLMQCVNKTDVNAAIPGMLYDWLTIPDLTVDSFLTDLDGATGGAAAAQLRTALIAVLGVLADNPDTARDMIAVVAQLIDADTAPIVVHTLLAIRGQGVVGEVLHLQSTLAQCRPDALASTP
ncbi:MAG TPA: hypothetical protein VGO62_10420 [Myxococcota bacterium]